MKNNNWISFAKERPKVGDSIDIAFEDKKSWNHNPYGKITSIKHVKDLDSSHCIVMDTYNKDSWTINSNKYIGSVVKSTYYWKLSK